MAKNRLIRAAGAAGAAVILWLGGALAALAAGPFTFPAIEGGTIALDDYRGRPVLVVNSASRCAFTRQYDDLQELYDRYRDRGLVVLAVPSQDFRQELSSNEEVAEFCALNYDLDLPMTGITPVRGGGAHPFYRWLAEAHGFAPKWNFNKVLLDGEGALVATFGSPVHPLSGRITGPIEELLAGG